MTDLLIVRKGLVKTRSIARDGRERIIHFHFPGELVGLEAIHTGRHSSEAIAIEHSECCRISFDQLMSLSERDPRTQRQLLAMMSARLDRAALVAGDLSAEERVAVFLLDVRDRLPGDQCAQRGLRLGMSRADMANHLRLAAETVSRVLSRFRSRGWIDIAGRRLRSMDIAPLERLKQGASAGD